MAIQHMVMVQFREGTAAETIAELLSEVRRMKDRIPGIQFVQGGPYESPEGLNDGFTHGFLVTFVDAAARDAYLPHPEHERVKSALLPHLARVVAFDFDDRQG